MWCILSYLDVVATRLEAPVQRLRGDRSREDRSREDRHWRAYRCTEVYYGWGADPHLKVYYDWNAYPLWREVKEVYLQLCQPGKRLLRYDKCRLTDRSGLEIGHEISGSAIQVQEALTSLKAFLARRMEFVMGEGEVLLDRTDFATFLLDIARRTYACHPGFAAIVREYIVDLHPNLILLDTDFQKSTQADFLVSLGLAYGRLQNWKKARDAMEEAVELYEKEAERDVLQLLKTLSLLGEVELVLENWLGAGRAKQKAARVRVQIAPQMPIIHQQNILPELFKSAFCFSKAGLPTEAVSMEREAITLYDWSLPQAPETYSESLADCLGCLPEYLEDMDRWTEAVRAIAKLVDLAMFSVSPHSYRQKIAERLERLGGKLFKEGKWEEAIEAYQPLVVLLERMFETSPEAHMEELATFLNILGFCLERENRKSEAAVILERNVTFRRKLFSNGDHPSRFLLTYTLNGLAWNLHLCGRSADGLPPARESITLLRQSSSPDSARTNLYLSMAMSIAANCLYSLGQYVEAFVYSEEAVYISRLLRQSKDEEKCRECLETYRKILDALDRWEDAEEIEAEIASIR